MKYLLNLLFFLCLSLGAQNTSFNPEIQDAKLYNYASFANVGNQKLSVSEVIDDSEITFNPLESENQTVGFTSYNFWVRFKLENTAKEKKIYFLETARPITDEVDLYQITNKETLQFKSGDKLPFKERQVKHRASIFKIELSPNTVNQFYIHYKSDGETINLPLNIYTQDEFLQENYQQQLFFGLFYGVVFLAGIIYLFFYKSLKEKTFLFYSFYVFSIALLQAALDGLIFQYILPNGGYLNDKAVLITGLCSNLFLLKYCEYFLKVKENLPWSYKGFKLIYITIFILFIMVLVSPKTMKLVYPMSNLNGLVSLLLILTSLFVLRYKGIKIDIFFSVGVFFLVIGLLGFVMNNLSLLPNNFYVLNSAKFGAGFEVIFLSLSMTNLIRELRVEKEKSQEIALVKSEEISELKTYFMSNISHELRTPINAIMGIAELQINENNNDEQRKNFEIIKNASLSLLSNVNDILDFELIEKNELKLKQENFNPLQTITQISNNWELEAKNKGLTYALKVEDDLPKTVKGDSERLGQIINNVLSNAVKYTTEGNVTLKITGKPLEDNKHQINFLISDTGVGIEEKVKNNVFDSFNQMRLNHKRTHGGIGLGLNIVKHLVQLFNGSINIESLVDVGTRVYIELPLEVVKTSNKVLFTEENSNTTLNILVVEDNLLNQMVMRKILSSVPNVTFIVANNGNEAIEALKKDTFDVVLMDLQMPVMDGYEATKIIRNGDLGDIIKSVPIIAVTADAMQETRERVMTIGMNDYINKPVNKVSLFEKIYVHISA
jgi:two-component system, sensor histidine kinase LadS